MSAAIKSSCAVNAEHCAGDSVSVLSLVFALWGVLPPSETRVALGLIRAGGAACQILKSSLSLDLQVGEVSAC